MFNIVLYAPEIPANTGNIGRTCVVTGTHLHLVEPLGFSLDDKTVRRAGLGYWQNLDVTTYAGWEDFLARNDLSPADERLHLLTKKARRTYAQSTYRDGDYLVFGSESSGIPEELLAAAPDALRAHPDAARLRLTRQRRGLGSPRGIARAYRGRATRPSFGRISAATSSIRTTTASAPSTSPTAPPSSSTRLCAKQAFRECDKGTFPLLHSSATPMARTPN